jgi:hypothetical protein
MPFPGIYNFPYYLGDTYTFVLHPKNSDGTPFDLSDYTAKFFIADRRGVLGVQHEAQAIVDSVNRCWKIPVCRVIFVRCGNKSGN